MWRDSSCGSHSQGFTQFGCALVKVAADARIDTLGVDQDFALIIATQPAAPGTGIVSLNREAYRTGDVIHVQLMDEDLAGQPTAAVTIKSTVEVIAESVELHAAGNYGLFTGTIAIATGPAISDGKLQVADGRPDYSHLY